jgi:hypothetical protein
VSHVCERACQYESTCTPGPPSACLNPQRARAGDALASLPRVHRCGLHRRTRGLAWPPLSDTLAPVCTLLAVPSPPLPCSIATPHVHTRTHTHARAHAHTLTHTACRVFPTATATVEGYSAGRCGRRMKLSSRSSRGASHLRSANPHLQHRTAPPAASDSQAGSAVVTAHAAAATG